MKDQYANIAFDIRSSLSSFCATATTLVLCSYARQIHLTIQLSSTLWGCCITHLAWRGSSLWKIRVNEYATYNKPFFQFLKCPINGKFFYHPWHVRKQMSIIRSKFINLFPFIKVSKTVFPYIILRKFFSALGFTFSASEHRDSATETK